MRMWMVDPRLMCRKHLLGEHVELHMLVGSLRKGVSLDGFFENKLIELHSIERRHAQLVREMERRGFRHASPIVVKSKRAGRVDRRANLVELARRCGDCRERQEKVKK
jgi:Pyrimidine dimer DNA glycosylase